VYVKRACSVAKMYIALLRQGCAQPDMRIKTFEYTRKLTRTHRKQKTREFWNYIIFLLVFSISTLQQRPVEQTHDFISNVVDGTVCIYAFESEGGCECQCECSCKYDCEREHMCVNAWMSSERVYVREYVGIYINLYIYASKLYISIHIHICTCVYTCICIRIHI